MKNKMFVFWIMFNFWWSAEWSEQITLTEAQKNEKSPPSHWKIKCLFLDYIQLLMIGRVIWAKNVDRNAKKWKRPPKSSKNKMFNFWWLAEWSEQITLTKTEKNEKGPLSHLFLDYVQLLMIGRVIWAKNVDQKAKKWKRPPKSSKNKMFVFGLCSTSDDRPSDLSKKHWPKHKKMPPKSLKNKMFVFGLHSTSDDRPSDLSKKCWPKCKKMKKAP